MYYHGVFLSSPSSSILPPHRNPTLPSGTGPAMWGVTPRLTRGTRRSAATRRLTIWQLEHRAQELACILGLVPRSYRAGLFLSSNLVNDTFDARRTRKRDRSLVFVVPPESLSAPHSNPHEPKSPNAQDKKEINTTSLYSVDPSGLLLINQIRDCGPASSRSVPLCGW